MPNRLRHDLEEVEAGGSTTACGSAMISNDNNAVDLGDYLERHYAVYRGEQAGFGSLICVGISDSTARPDKQHYIPYVMRQTCLLQREL